MIKEAYPLQWPAGRGRYNPWHRKSDPFKVPSGKIRNDLARELRLMGVDDFVVSSMLMIRNDGLPYANQREPDDPGVALYFVRKGQEICISCDQYAKIDANLRAIGKTVEAIRGMERWGTEEMVDRAFTGFAALPESIITPPPSDNRPHRPWQDVLGVKLEANAHEVKAAYRRLLKLYHPDVGGTEADLMEIRNAYEEWKAQ